jgi:phage terminase small subunit
MTDAAPIDTPKPKRQRNPTTPTTKGKTFMKLKLPDGLTVQQEAYARARAWGMSQKEAIGVITGGKSTEAGTGCHWEKKPEVKNRINQLRQEITERAVEKAAVDRAWVKPTGEYKFDSAGANRSLELIGKELGMFVERKQIEMNPLGSLSDTELARIAAELAAQTGVIDVQATVVPQLTGENVQEQG